MWKCPRLVCHDLLDVVHSSKMTTFEVEFEFREEECHTGTDEASMGTAEPLEYPFWYKKKIRSLRWQCDRERCLDAASKCPQSLAGHDEPFF